MTLFFQAGRVIECNLSTHLETKPTEEQVKLCSEANQKKKGRCIFIE